MNVPGGAYPPESLLRIAELAYRQHHGAFLQTTKARAGFIEGETKPVKPPLPPESKAQMTFGALNRFNKAMYYKGAPRFIDAAQSGNERVETILVHGTFNPDAPEVGWTRPDLEVNQRLQNRYGGGITALQWSGKNHRKGRIAAAEALAKRISENTEKNVRTNVIAHSHGGNVAFEAIKLLGSSAGTIDQLVTLGTPIRKDHLPTREEIERKTLGYLHVSGGRDKIAPKGGFDFVKAGRGVLGDKGRFQLKAKRGNALADMQLHITDATHSELHARAVLDLLGPATYRKAKPVK